MNKKLTKSEQRRVDKNKDRIYHKDLWKFLYDNEERLTGLSNEVLNIKKEDTHWGDRYLNGSGERYVLKFGDGSSYSVGYEHVTEDADDWAQAECHRQDICRDLEEFTSIECEVIMDKLLKL